MSRLASTVHRFGASTSPLSTATKLGTIKYCRNALPPGSLLLPATWSGGVKRVECCQCAASARAPLLRRDSSRIRGCQVVAVQGVETILEATVSTLLVRYFFFAPPRAELTSNRRSDQCGWCPNRTTDRCVRRRYHCKVCSVPCARTGPFWDSSCLIPLFVPSHSDLARISRF